MHKCTLTYKSYVGGNMKTKIIKSKIAENAEKRNRDLTAWYDFRLLLNRVRDNRDAKTPFYKLVNILHSSSAYRRYSLDTYLDYEYGLSEWHRVLVIRAVRNSLKKHSLNSIPVERKKSKRIRVEEQPRTFVQYVKEMFSL